MHLSTDIQESYYAIAQEDRCAPRLRIRIPAQLRASGGQAFPVVVTDLSIAGFACEAVTGMSKGSLCWLTLPGMTGLQSEVIWNTGHIVGCAFSHLLNGAVLDSILARHC
jgi:hypothetical protein